MVQPTRMVCCACDAPMLAKSDAAAPAATIHFETICITPAPHALPAGPCAQGLAQPFMGQRIGQAMGMAGSRRIPAGPQDVVERRGCVLNRPSTGSERNGWGRRKTENK